MSRLISKGYLKKMFGGPPFESKTTKKDKVLAFLKDNVWQKLPGTSTKMDTWALLDHTLVHEVSLPTTLSSSVANMSW